MFKRVVFVIEIEMCVSKTRLLHNDLSISIPLDRSSLGFSVVIVIDIYTYTFTFITTVTNRVEEVLPKTSPSSCYDSSGKLFTCLGNILIIHTYLIARDVCTVVVQHRKIC
jgi:hypothetical protein